MTAASGICGQLRVDPRIYHATLARLVDAVAQYGVWQRRRTYARADGRCRRIVDGAY